ncbi:hypothetical protein ACJJTC_016120 [Scirpophaga incertulas]
MKYIVLFDILAYHCARNAPKPRYEYHSGDPEFAFYFIIGFARNTSMDEDDVNVRYVDAAGSAAEPIRPSLWSSRLPPHVQAIIMSQTSDTLEAVAELADRICEVTPARVQQIASTGNNTNCDASLLKRIDEIVTARIRTEIANHVAQIDRQRGRSRDRFRPRGRSRKSLNLRGGWCGNTSPSPSRPARATAEGGTRGDASQQELTPAPPLSSAISDATKHTRARSCCRAV